jgi:hypothetical protein
MPSLRDVGQASTSGRHVSPPYIPPYRGYVGPFAGSAFPLAFGLQQAQHSYMMPGMMKHKPTAGARRAAGHIVQDPSHRESTAALIDRETGLRELIDIVEEIIDEAGDLIESRNPELVARARDVLRHSSDDSPRQAE